jgi:diguanylate cyclase (GGDEF)-like protein
MRLTTWPGKKYYNAFLDRVIPADIDRVSQTAIGLTNLCHLFLLALFFVPAFVLQYLLLGNWNLAFSLMLAGVLMALAPWVYKLTGKLWIAREQFIVPLIGFKVWETILFGGVVSPGTIWFITPPIIAILLGSVRAAVVWLGIAIATVIGLQLVLGDNVDFANTPVAHPHFMFVFSLIGLCLALAAFVLMVETSRISAFQGLEKANQTIRDIAMRDALTGVYNRRHVWTEIGKEEVRASQDHSMFCVCIVDLDKFKSINDTFGHAVGDDVLRMVAKAIESEVRQGDCFGRYGGEEFLLLLKDTSREGAKQFSERIRERTEALRFADYPDIRGITVSVGIAEYHEGEKFSNTIDRADKALYAAKSGGRNLVRVAA